ncbi:MAG: ABC transporter ATP-binding protein [Dehalococcoidia bacterium]|nr:ABC transporter ATP-binding protein [Dehalococcoidia bacterium]
MQAPTAVEAVDVVRSYGERRALDGFSLSVPAGGVFGLLGPNGSGKSTFITLLAAMEAPPEGRLAVFGEAPAPPLRARVGTVFQENAQDPLLSVRETLGLAGRLFDVPRATLAARQAELLVAFGLAGRENDGVASLSGGMRRRLEMVRALLHDPELVLLDEPTTGVDVDERRALWEALLGPARARRTILLATNDLAEADAVCDQVAFVSAGRVVATGTPSELKRGLRREAVRVTWPGVTDEQLATIATWPGAGDVTRQDGVLHVTVDDAAAFVPRLFEFAPGAIRGVQIEQSTLEDAYVRYVGHRTRTPEPVA